MNDEAGLNSRVGQEIKPTSQVELRQPSLLRPPLSAKTTSRSGWLRWGIRLTGTILLLIFLWKFNLNLGQISADLLKVNLWPVLASILLIFPILALKTVRW